MNTLGNKLRVTLFGESHGPAIGCTIDGLPAGFQPDMEAAAAFLARRAPGKFPWSTSRREADQVEVLSGLYKGRCCGSPLTAVMQNTNARSGDYEALHQIPRPSHADFPARVKFGSSWDGRGGGAFSGRLTAPLCFAGALALQLLQQRKIEIYAHAASVGKICDRLPDFAQPDVAALRGVAQKVFPTLDDASGQRMCREIAAARDAGDSVGGTIRCFALGLPVGLGEPMFGGMENRLSGALFGIPGIRAVAFGDGFQAGHMYGSQHNDPYYVSSGAVKTRTNHAGGVLGGLTTGMPLVVEVVVKPTASIAMEQDTVDLSAMENTKLSMGGRHDPCIVPRAVPVVEAVTALTLLDLLLEDTL